MRKMILVASVIAITTACNNNTNDSKPAAKADSTKSAEEDPVVKEGLKLVASKTCFSCHQVDRQLVGPAYTAVAARYPKNDAVIDSLADKVMKGGSGNWGTIPMTPNPVTKEEAKTMVTYILSLKK